MKFIKYIFVFSLISCKPSYKLSEPNDGHSRVLMYAVPFSQIRRLTLNKDLLMISYEHAVVIKDEGSVQELMNAFSKVQSDSLSAPCNNVFKDCRIYLQLINEKNKVIVEAEIYAGATCIDINGKCFLLNQELYGMIRKHLPASYQKG